MGAVARHSHISHLPGIPSGREPGRLFLIDSLGSYFLLRRLIRDRGDIARTITTLAGIVFLISAVMVNERLHAVNLFGYIGGRLVPFVRDGVIRSQGPFVGPIPAGTFAATLLCLFLWLALQPKSRRSGIAGIVGAFVMILTSASSTPLMATAAAFLAVAMWPVRAYMRSVRWVSASCCSRCTWL